MDKIAGPPVPYRSAQQLKDWKLEKEALEKQVEELRAWLWRAKNHTTCLEEKLEDFSREMEEQMIQRKSLQKQVMELHHLLIQEHSMGLHLSKQLKDTKAQLIHQMFLKEMFIKEGKEACDELRRLKRFSGKKTMDAMRIGPQFERSTKMKRKKVLQVKFEELKVVRDISQEKFSAELQVEREKDKALQRELTRTSLRYDTELKAEREKRHSPRRKVQNDIQFQAKRALEDPELEKQQRGEKKARLGQTEEEIQIQTQAAGQDEPSRTKASQYSCCQDVRRNQRQDEPSGTKASQYSCCQNVRRNQRS
ncbi:hypothetical protein PAMP_021819 [Pampus punctatissimus]